MRAIRLRHWIAFALAVIAAAGSTAWPLLRRGGSTGPQVELTRAECGRVAAKEPRTASDEVVVVDVRNVGDTEVEPGLALTVLQAAPDRGLSATEPLGRTVGSRMLASSLAPGRASSVVIRIETPIDPCDGRTRVAAAGVSATAQRASVNPSPYVEDFAALAPAALATLVNQAGARATWRMDEGYLEARGGGGVLFSPAEWEDYDAEVSLIFPDGVDNDAAILFRAKDAVNWYQLRVDSSRVRLMALVEGRLRTVASAEFAAIRSGSWHRLKVEVRGTRVSGYVDDMLVLQYNNLQLAAGAVGVMQDDVRVRYDDVVIRPIIGAARRR